MRFATLLGGIISTALLALVAAMPWSANEVGRLVLQMLPLLAIIFWSFPRPTPMAATTIFLVGLFTDIVVQAPVGYWTTIALVAAMFVRATSASAAGTSTTGRAIIVAAAIVLVASSAFGLSYLHTLRADTIEAYALAALFASMAYVPLAVTLATIVRFAASSPSVHPVLDRGT
jgi:cell shape-determining protein MreD